MTDTVTMQVIRYALEQIADEMGYTLVRTGRSTLITEIKDISCVITDARGTPLAITLTGGNRHDVTQLLPLLDAIPHAKGRTGRPRHRPGQVFADRGYDFDKYRRLVRAKNITPRIACRGTPHSSGLGTHRWVVGYPEGFLEVCTGALIIAVEHRRVANSQGGQALCHRVSDVLHEALRLGGPRRTGLDVTRQTVEVG